MQSYSPTTVSFASSPISSMSLCMQQYLQALKSEAAKYSEKYSEKSWRG